MGECNLDWKKVFKEILGPKSSPRNVVFTDEGNREFGSSVTCSEVKNSIVCDSSQTVYTKNSNKDTSKTNVPNKEWGKVTQCYTGSTSASKEKFVRKVLPSKLPSTCIVQDEMSSSNGSKGDVPKWDTAFKVILGSTKDVQPREDVQSVIKKPEPLQKQNVPVKNKRVYKKKWKNFKAKNNVDEEEKKVREIFARSRIFKLECPVSNINDLAGCGVDIFKCGKIMHSSFEVKVPEELEMQDDSYTDYSDLSVPVTGLIANVKPLTRDEILNADCVPLTEIWDDDFLF